MKLRNKKGFTLVEMLIVVAIIAVLIAIAIPVFRAQLDRARVATDEANLRAAKSLAVATYLLNDPEDTAAVVYGVSKDGEGGLVVGAEATAEDISVSDDYNVVLKVTVTGGAVTATSWD